MYSFMADAIPQAWSAAGPVLQAVSRGHSGAGEGDGCMQQAPPRGYGTHRYKDCSAQGGAGCVTVGCQARAHACTCIQQGR